MGPRVKAASYGQRLQVYDFVDQPLGRNSRDTRLARTVGAAAARRERDATEMIVLAQICTVAASVLGQQAYQSGNFSDIFGNSPAVELPSKQRPRAAVDLLATLWTLLGGVALTMAAFFFGAAATLMGMIFAATHFCARVMDTHTEAGSYGRYDDTIDDGIDMVSSITAWFSAQPLVYVEIPCRACGTRLHDEEVGSLGDGAPGTIITALTAAILGRTYLGAKATLTECTSTMNDLAAATLSRAIVAFSHTCSAVDLRRVYTHLNRASYSITASIRENTIHTVRMVTSGFSRVSMGFGRAYLRLAAGAFGRVAWSNITDFITSSFELLRASANRALSHVLTCGRQLGQGSQATYGQHIWTSGQRV